jgi:glycosyltransferase involved in cell wall biosynthesis
MVGPARGASRPQVVSDESAPPLVSVVIPTRARPARLAFALEALAAQTLDLSRFEVLIVRDADDEESALDPPSGLRAGFIVGPPRGTPAEKRNLGWRAARAPLIAFTDDDCRPAPGWLEALCEAEDRFGNAGDLVLQGPVTPDPDEAPLLTGLARSLVVTASSRWFPTANLALERSLLEELEGFDESYRRAGAEDTDLALRALERGARHVFLPEAGVWHAVHTRTLLGALRDARRADGLAPLFARHPDQRREIFAGVFWKRSHANALLALAGLALARRGRPLTAALACLPFLIDSYDSSKPATPRHLLAVGAHLPLRLTVDLVETASTVQGAAAAGVVLA